MRRKSLLVASVVFKTASAWFFFGIHQPCRYGPYLKTCIASTVMGRHVVGQTTYGLVTLMCSLVYSRHNNATTIILINDNYTVLTSIKDGKHEPWAATHTNLHNVYPKEAEKISILPNPNEWSEIGKQCSITEDFKGSIQGNCLSSASWINLICRGCCLESH